MAKIPEQYADQPEIVNAIIEARRVQIETEDTSLAIEWLMGHYPAGTGPPLWRGGLTSRAQRLVLPLPLKGSAHSERNKDEGCGLPLRPWQSPPWAPQTEHRFTGPDDSTNHPQLRASAITDLVLTLPTRTILLSWDTPDDDSITGYQILRRQPSEGEHALSVYVADTGSTGTSFTDTDVTTGTLHVYRVKAINAAGVKPGSNYVRVEP